MAMTPSPSPSQTPVRPGASEQRLGACGLAADVPSRRSIMAVKVGDRVAQLVLERIYTPEVKEVDSLEDTARGVPHYTP